MSAPKPLAQAASGPISKKPLKAPASSQNCR